MQVLFRKRFQFYGLYKATPDNQILFDIFPPGDYNETHMKYT